MRNDGDAALNDGLDLRDVRAASLQLHRLGAGLRQDARAGDRLFGRRVGRNGQIGDDHRALHRARHGAGVMPHVLQRHQRRVRIAEHHHAERIADQHEIDSALIQQPRRGIIIGRERCDLFSAALHRVKGGDPFSTETGVVAHSQCP